MWNKGLTTSNKGDWATPWHFFNELDNEFGFTIDVCADKSNAKCRVYYTREDNGLIKRWSGVCFMNPPYGREIGLWVEKAYNESKSERFDSPVVVGLLPARTDTRWFHNWIYGKAEIRFIKGRLKFGDGKNSAPFPSMLVVWR